MLELSMHILDIVENSIRAAATLVEIYINEDTLGDRLTVEITDDGEGMNQTRASKVLDPFFTTKKVRNVGLGLPLFDQAAQTAGGRLSLKTEEGKGTHVLAVFKNSHIDRQPLGSMSDTITALVAGNPDIDFLYTHEKDGLAFTLDTREIRKELDGVSLSNARVLRFIKEFIEEELKEIAVEQ
ncbi:MAG: sensor histidine kinase [Deltaproteobacteria bacterium]|nr:sensor histidine kinase [Deltaproteobacteria bacterium]